MNRKDAMEGVFMKKITIACFLLLSTLGIAEARKPAVEPVTGISIQDYKEIPPSQAKGYNFQKGKPQNVAKKGTSPTITNTTVKTVETKTTKQLSGADAPAWPVSLFLFVLIALPFGAWFGIMKSLQKENEDQVVPSNTLAFPTKDNSTDDDDYNLPKAG